jgi:hypothetical protein
MGCHIRSEIYVSELSEHEGQSPEWCVERNTPTKTILTDPFPMRTSERFLSECKIV